MSSARIGEIRDNAAQQRFEMDVGDEIAELRYRLSPGVITLTHTETPRQYEGQGIGSALVRAVLDQARARGLKVVPACDFVASVIRKHPEYADLLK